jgi:hypothetical protein
VELPDALATHCRGLAVGWYADNNPDIPVDDVRALVTEHLTSEMISPVFEAYVESHPQEAAAFARGDISTETFATPIFIEILESL